MKPIVLILLLALSAAAQKVEIESDQTTDFSRFHTFSMREGRLNAKNPELNNEIIRKKIDTDIRKAMEAKGFSFVESGPADLVVQYTLGAAKKIEREAYPAGWRGLGTRVARVPYTEGTLVIDLRDRAAKSLVWRAIARADGDAAKVENKLDDMVRKSFEKYPPKAK